MKSTLTAKEQFLKDNQREGERYAGIVLGQNGAPDYHLFVIQDEAENVTWQGAMEFAKKVGGVLMNRRELRLVWVNAKDAFNPAWYWSSEKHASVSDYAWVQLFYGGHQYYGGAGSRYRARAVRRLEIQ